MIVGMHGMRVVGNTLYFTLVQTNGLCCMDLITKNVQYLGYIPNEPIDGECLYGYIVKCGDKLILAPENATHIAIYDLNRNDFTCIKFDETKNKGTIAYPEGEYFNGLFAYGKNVFFIPRKYPAIICLGMDDLKLSYLDAWFECFRKEYTPDFHLFRESIAIDDHGHATLLSRYYRKTVTLDIGKQMETDIIGETRKINDKCSCIAYFNGCYIITDENKKEIRIFDENWEQIKCIPYDSGAEENVLDYIGTTILDNSLFFIPFRAKKMLKVNAEDFSVVEIRVCDQSEELKYIRFWTYDSKLYCYRDYFIDVYDNSGSKVETFQLNVDPSFYSQNLRKMLGEKPFVDESDLYGLECLLGAV